MNPTECAGNLKNKDVLRTCRCEKLSGHEFKFFGSMRMHSRHGKVLHRCEHCPSQPSQPSQPNQEVRKEDQGRIEPTPTKQKNILKENRKSLKNGVPFITETVEIQCKPSPISPEMVSINQPQMERSSTIFGGKNHAKTCRFSLPPPTYELA